MGAAALAVVGPDLAEVEADAEAVEADAEAVEADAEAVDAFAVARAEGVGVAGGTVKPSARGKGSAWTLFWVKTTDIIEGLSKKGECHRMRMVR